MITPSNTTTTDGNRGKSKAEMEILDTCRLVDDDMSWMQYAACKQSKVDFFPESAFNSASVPALKLCEECAVQDLCLRFALVNKIEYGIWGGKTAANRRSLIRHCYRNQGREPRLTKQELGL